MEPEYLRASYLSAPFSWDNVSSSTDLAFRYFLISLETQDFVRTGKSGYLRMNLSLHFS
jgi:hypothetical protein